MSFIRRPTQAAHAFLGGTIRSQLIWAFGCVSLVMMLVFAGLLYQQQRQFLYQAALQQSVSLATTLASSSISWVLANDIVGLREVLQGFAEIKDLKRAYILSLSGEVLSSTQIDEIGLFVTDGQSQKLLQSLPKPQVLLANARQIDVAVPVVAGKRHVGWARVEMTLHEVQQNLHGIVIMGVEFILLAVLAIVVAALLLAMRLTKSLRHLMRVAKGVGQGRRDLRAQLRGADEVQVLAQVFNQMLDALSASERQLEQINQLYAAWTESVDVIVRESDEATLFNQVCQIIAKHVDFKLIWVGMLGSNGQLQVEATNRPESACLHEIMLSVSTTVPEGGGIVGRAIRERTPVILNHFLEEILVPSWYESAKVEQILAAAAFPLTRSGRCVGAIGVYSGEENYFSSDLITLVGGLADDLSYALDNLDREQRRLADEERIRHLAFYDALTKLPNRTLLFERLTAALHSSHRHQTHGALMFLDLDNFKTLNDTLGHDRGDQLLIEVGQRLQSCVRETDTVARLGGDEFVLMLEDLSTQVSDASSQAQTVADKIRARLGEPYLLLSDSQQLAMIKYHSTASIGFVLFVGYESSVEELLKQADLAMYQAKQAGRNTVRAFVPEMQTALNVRTALERELRSALERDELRLYYQMQVDINGQPVGAEVLIRWHQTERGLVYPDIFIPLAEESGLIVPIGLWTLRQSCETLQAWAQHSQTRALKLGVNISSCQLSQVDFVEQVRGILQETGINPALLKLEITESMILENVEETIRKMRQIQALGVNFALDDFGTGYSSLSYLQKLPLEQLKIDKSFVQDLTTNKNDAAIVRTILALGQNLALDIVAEGVESQEQLEHLRAAGCTLFQGYLFSKPVMEQEFRQQLSERLAASK